MQLAKGLACVTSRGGTRGRLGPASVTCMPASPERGLAKARKTRNRFRTTAAMALLYLKRTHPLLLALLALLSASWGYCQDPSTVPAPSLLAKETLGPATLAARPLTFQGAVNPSFYTSVGSRRSLVALTSACLAHPIQHVAMCLGCTISVFAVQRGRRSISDRSDCRLTSDCTVQGEQLPYQSQGSRGRAHGSCCRAISAPRGARWVTCEDEGCRNASHNIKPYHLRQLTINGIHVDPQGQRACLETFFRDNFLNMTGTDNIAPVQRLAFHDAMGGGANGSLLKFVEEQMAVPTLSVRFWTQKRVLLAPFATVYRCQCSRAACL